MRRILYQTVAKVVYKCPVFWVYKGEKVGCVRKVPVGKILLMVDV